MATISGAISSYSRYNSGRGDFWIWLDFPATDEEIKQALEKIGNPEEWFFSDWENDTGIKLEEFTSIKEANEIAEFIANLAEHEEAAFSALCEYFGDFESARKVYKSENYQFYDDCTTELDLGYIAAECWEIPEAMQFYFDYEKLGSDTNLNAVGGFYGNGFLEIY